MKILPRQFLAIFFLAEVQPSTVLGPSSWVRETPSKFRRRPPALFSGELAGDRVGGPVPPSPFLSL